MGVLKTKLYSNCKIVKFKSKFIFNLPSIAKCACSPLSGHSGIFGIVTEAAEKLTGCSLSEHLENI